MCYYELYNMDNEEKLQQAYLDSLTEKERKGYEIAKSHLGMSFDLEKSIGYLEWKKQKQT
jgi:hypothetical protein